MDLLEALTTVHDLIGEIDQDEVRRAMDTGKAAAAEKYALEKAREELTETLRQNDETRSLFARELVKLKEDLAVAKNAASVELKRVQDLTKDAKAELAMARQELISVRFNHDQVLASLESLKKKLA